MPPRGAKRAWEAALRHASTIPEDSVGLWACKGPGHRFFTVGPVVDYLGRLLARAPEGTGMTGSNGLRAVLCACGKDMGRRVGLPKEVNKAARAVWRMDGELGVWALLVTHVRLTGGVLYYPHFAVLEHRWNREITQAFPTSAMSEGMQQVTRYKPNDNRTILIIDDPQIV